MPSFFSSAFLVAGAIAALAPVIIHLLNRRRHRVLRWAAMDFLREAMQRSRRILRLRDFILLVLRTACLLLFGLAMARPYFSSGGGSVTLDQPVHAVMVVDNSMSMGYERLNGTALDEAKARARQFIDRLPEGSRISVLPLCGSATEYTFDAYRTPRDALDALDAIGVTDRSGTVPQALEIARIACAREPDLTAKRVVLIGDQQARNWPSESLESSLDSLPDVQVVQIATDRRENSWIEGFRVQDDIADVESPTAFVATVRHAGDSGRKDVEVVLRVDGETVSARTIDLEPGQARELRFPHHFGGRSDADGAAYALAELSLRADRLPADDRRLLVVPVLSSLPVVFVDALGSDEDPAKNRYGETFHLRRLMAPLTEREGRARQLIEIRHLRADQLDQESIQDARLVVMAGIEGPGNAVDVLREYVEQGGQLVIAAGGRFNPGLWTDAAWLDGRGILPLPLAPEPIGGLPDSDATSLEPFFIDVGGLEHPYFAVEQASRRELEDLYQAPIFFKALRVEMGDEPTTTLLAAETERLSMRREARDAEPGDRRWLLWRGDEDSPGDEFGDAPIEELARRTLPRVLASFTNGAPFLIERDIGAGTTLLVTSGVAGRWNTLTRSNAVLLFDRILRAAIARTLPRRNLDSLEEIELPVDASERRSRFTLTRPNGVVEPIAVDVVGEDRYALRVRSLVHRGRYTITAFAESAARGAGDGVDLESATKLWERTFAVNGAASESELDLIGEAAVAERSGEEKIRWIGPDESISLEGAAVSGEGIWRWLMAAVLALFIVELLVLAWPAARAPVASPAGGARP